MGCWPRLLPRQSQLDAARVTSHSPQRDDVLDLLCALLWACGAAARTGTEEWGEDTGEKLRSERLQIYVQRHAMRLAALVVAVAGEPAEAYLVEIGDAITALKVHCERIRALANASMASVPLA